MKTKENFSLGAFVIWLYVNDLPFYKVFELKFKQFVDSVSSKSSKEVK